MSNTSNKGMKEITIKIRLNEPQEATFIETKKAINGCHYTDIVIKKDGKDLRFEADYLRDAFLGVAPQSVGCTTMNTNRERGEIDWEEHFYKDSWKPDTLTLTDAEKEWMEQMTSFLPRHMPVYDWNLPYAEMILLITRRTLLAQALKDAREETIKECRHLVYISASLSDAHYRLGEILSSSPNNQPK